MKAKRLFERAWEVEAIRIEIVELRKPVDNMVEAFRRAEAEKIRVMEQASQLVMIQSVLGRLFATQMSVMFRQWLANMSASSLGEVHHRMWQVLEGTHNTVKIYQRRLKLEAQRTGLGIVNAVLRVWLQQEALQALGEWSEKTAMDYYIEEVQHEDKERERRSQVRVEEDRQIEADFDPSVEKKAVKWTPPKAWEPSDEWSNFSNVFPARPNLEETGQALWQLADHPGKLAFGSAGGWMGHSQRKHPRDGCSCAACKSADIYTSKEHPSVRPPKSLGVAYPELGSSMSIYGNNCLITSILLPN